MAKNSADSDRPNDEASASRDQDQPMWGTFREPSIAIVDAIADATGRDPTDVSPLYEHVDPDALDAFVGGERADGGNRVEVSFVHDGVVVTVDSSAGIETRLLTDASE